MDSFSKRNDPRFTGVRPDFARQIDRHLGRLRSLRIVATALIEGEEAKKALRMADNSGKVLIKGLAEAMTAARRSIADARIAPAALQKAAADLKATCDELTTQVTAMHEDIKFEATQLGNSGEVSEMKSEG